MTVRGPVNGKAFPGCALMLDTNSRHLCKAAMFQLPDLQCLCSGSWTPSRPCLKLECLLAVQQVNHACLVQQQRMALAGLQMPSAVTATRLGPVGHWTCIEQRSTAVCAAHACRTGAIRQSWTRPAPADLLLQVVVTLCFWSVRVRIACLNRLQPTHSSAGQPCHSCSCSLSQVLCPLPDLSHLRASGVAEHHSYHQF